MSKKKKTIIDTRSEGEKSLCLLNRTTHINVQKEMYKRSYYEFYKKAFTILTQMNRTTTTGILKYYVIDSNKNYIG